MAVRVVRIYESRNPVVVIVNVIFAIIYLFIGARILLRLLGIGADVPIVSFIYQISGSLLSPFAGILPSITLANNFVLDLTAILGLIVFAIINWLLVELFLYAFGGTE